MTAVALAHADSPLHERDVVELAAEAQPLAGLVCTACGAEQARSRFAVGGLSSRVVVCGGCGLGWLSPMPDADEIAGFYPEVYYGGETTKFRPLVERLVRLVGARHVRFLTAGLPRGARVLDVGCGRGVLLAALADRGFEVHGVEHSESAARGADPRARIRVAPRLADARYAADSFDQVIIWHVLEHLPDPRGTLVEVLRILRPGGRLVVAVPNFESAQARWAGPAWFHLDLPRHLYQFPLSALRRLVRSIGFQVESEHHFSLRQNPFGWIQSALNRVPGLPRNGLYTLLHDRAPGEPPPFDARTRRVLRLAWLALAPPAIAASVVEAALHTGATVHLVARKRSG
jgi:SAM-dependent methyltransferase